MASDSPPTAWRAHLQGLTAPILALEEQLISPLCKPKLPKPKTAAKGDREFESYKRQVIAAQRKQSRKAGNPLMAHSPPVYDPSKIGNFAMKGSLAACQLFVQMSLPAPGRDVPPGRLKHALKLLRKYYVDVSAPFTPHPEALMLLLTVQRLGIETKDPKTIGSPIPELQALTPEMAQGKLTADADLSKKLLKTQDTVYGYLREVLKYDPQSALNVLLTLGAELGPDPVLKPGSAARSDPRSKQVIGKLERLGYLLRGLRLAETPLAVISYALEVGCLLSLGFRLYPAEHKRSGLSYFPPCPKLAGMIFGVWSETRDAYMAAKQQHHSGSPTNDPVSCLKSVLHQISVGMETKCLRDFSCTELFVTAPTPAASKSEDTMASSTDTQDGAIDSGMVRLASYLDQLVQVVREVCSESPTPEPGLGPASASDGAHIAHQMEAYRRTLFLQAQKPMPIKLPYLISLIETVTKLDTLAHISFRQLQTIRNSPQLRTRPEQTRRRFDGELLSQVVSFRSLPELAFIQFDEKFRESVTQWVLPSQEPHVALLFKPHVPSLSQMEGGASSSSDPAARQARVPASAGGSTDLVLPPASVARSTSFPQASLPPPSREGRLLPFDTTQFLRGGSGVAGLFGMDPGLRESADLLVDLTVASTEAFQRVNLVYGLDHQRRQQQLHTGKLDYGSSTLISVLAGSSERGSSEPESWGPWAAKTTLKYGTLLSVILYVARYALNWWGRPEFLVGWLNRLPGIDTLRHLGQWLLNWLCAVPIKAHAPQIQGDAALQGVQGAQGVPGVPGPSAPELGSSLGLPPPATG